MRFLPLQPFGVEVRGSVPGGKLADLNIRELRESIQAHLLCVLRGFEKPTQEEMLSFCRQLGKVRSWRLGEVVHLQVEENTKTFLFTNRPVLFHWDGAFSSETPNYIFLYCRVPPEQGAGGETIFCDASLLLRRATEFQRNVWKNVSITYTPDGSANGFDRDLVSKHPTSGKEVVRYAEPILEMNPLHLTIHGLSEEDASSFIEQMRSLLYDENYWYSHSWKEGDVLIADNHALLHGRRPFSEGTPRHLCKVNIISD